MIWSPEPSQIERVRLEGVGDMGDVTDPTKGGRISRGIVTNRRWVVLAVRALWTGGTGSNSLNIYQIDRRDPKQVYKLLLRSYTGMGTDGNADLFYRIPADELLNTWLFWPDDDLVFEWTNPDAGNMRWRLEVRVADAG